MHRGNENRKDYALGADFVSDAEEDQSLMPGPKARPYRQLMQKLLMAASL